MNKKKILIVSLLLNGVFIFLLYNTYVLHTGMRHRIGKILRANKVSAYENIRNNKEYTDLYAVYPRKQAAIVMLGDSITHGAEWNELLDRNDVVNRGIGGDNTLGMLRRMDFVYKLDPKICFIMGGVNDMKDGMSAGEVFDYYKKIIAGLEEHGVVPVIQSTLYSSKLLSRETDELDRLLKQYAASRDLYYMDLNKLLAVDKVLNQAYSLDGLHLNAKGYEVWGKEVESALKKYGL